MSKANMRRINIKDYYQNILYQCFWLNAINDVTTQCFVVLTLELQQ